MKKQEFLRQITLDQQQYSFYDITLLEKKGIDQKHIDQILKQLHNEED